MQLKAGITAAAIVAMAAFSFQERQTLIPINLYNSRSALVLVDHPVSPHALCRNVSKR